MSVVLIGIASGFVRRAQTSVSMCSVSSFSVIFFTTTGAPPYPRWSITCKTLIFILYFRRCSDIVRQFFPR